MADSLVSEIGQAVLASGLVTAAGWGALGGATSALAVGGVSRQVIIRQIVMGALVAGGTGTLAMALVAKVFGLDTTLIPLAGAGSSASYFAGVFGPAVIEVILGRIKSDRLPGESSKDE